MSSFSWGEGRTPRVPAASALSCSSFASPLCPQAHLVPPLLLWPLWVTPPSHLAIILSPPFLALAPQDQLPEVPPCLSLVPDLLFWATCPLCSSQPPSWSQSSDPLHSMQPPSVLPTLQLPLLGPAPDFSLPFSYLFPSLVLLLLLPLPVGASFQGKTCVLRGICVQSVPFWVGGEKG